MTRRVRYCDECRCDREAVVKKRNTTYTFRKEPFDVFENYLECNVCQNELFDEEFCNQTLKKLSELYEQKLNQH